MPAHSTDSSRAPRRGRALTRPLLALLTALLLSQAGCTSLSLIMATRGKLYLETGVSYGVSDVRSLVVERGKVLHVEVDYGDGETRTLRCDLSARVSGQLDLRDGLPPVDYRLAERVFDARPSGDLLTPVALDQRSVHGLGPLSWWRSLPDGRAAVALNRGAHVVWIVVPRHAQKEGYPHPLKVAGRIVGFPLTIALDLASLPLQPLFLPMSGPMLLFLMGPV